MTTAQFLLDPLPAEEVVVLDGPEGHHAATVRRLQPGERIRLTDGRGSVRVGVVARVGKAELSVRCGPIERLAAPSPRIVVVQALAKGERGELAVELLTELGADEIVPWSASRSVVLWRVERGEKALQRWRSTAREAGKQSRRAWLPRVRELASTHDVCARIAQSGSSFVLHEAATVSLSAAVLARTGSSARDDSSALSDSSTAGAQLPEPGQVLLVVGPEGGISPDEIAAFTRAGAVPVRLGEPVLRTSTAGAAGLAALSVLLGRWS